MTLVLLFVILIAVVAVGVCVWIIAQPLPGNSVDEFSRLGREVGYADQRMVQITAEGIQAMIDEALNEFRNRE